MNLSVERAQKLGINRASEIGVGSRQEAPTDSAGLIPAKVGSDRDRVTLTAPHDLARNAGTPEAEYVYTDANGQRRYNVNHPAFIAAADDYKQREAMRGSLAVVKRLGSPQAKSATRVC